MSGSLYTGVAGNVSLASTVQTTVPADGDNDNAATFTVGMQKADDYLEAFRNSIAVNSLNESFDGATFPPTTFAWQVPSPRFGADLSWARSTTNPIAGTASASAPVPQGTTTNSSLGLTNIAFTTPARVSFLWAVNCNASNSDHLDFFVDGVLTAQFSTVVSNTLVAGRFVTDLLREGPHSFDWRFVRGGSASVGSEEAKIDSVEVIPEEVWRTDPARQWFMDEGTVNVATTAAIGANSLVNPPWALFTSANAGTYGALTTSTGNAQVGSGLFINSAATAAGDWSTAQLACATGFQAVSLPFVEGNFCFRTSAGTNQIGEFGFFDAQAATAGDSICWAWDGSLGASSTLRWRRILAGAATDADSNVAINSGYFRLGIIRATVRGVTSAVFTKDGKALPGAASVPPLMATGLSNAAALKPGMRARSITSAVGAAAQIDWMRIMGLR